MRYSALGNTGLYVSQLTLGTMTFDQKEGPFAHLVGGTGQELVTKVVDFSIEAGSIFLIWPTYTPLAIRIADGGEK